MQRGPWLQSQQRKYINTKPLASLFSLVNISNTLRSGSCFQSPLCYSNADVVFSAGPGANCSATAGKHSAPWKNDCTNTPESGTTQTSFGLRGRPCQLPTKIQFAFGPQYSEATSIGFKVSNGLNIYRLRGGSIAEENEQSALLKCIIISDIPFSSTGGARVIFIRDTKKFINRATWHSELRIQGWSYV